MIDLNDIETLQKIDPQNSYGSTEQMFKQCETAWNEVNKISVPQEYREVNKLVFCGMGASIYGAMVFKALVGRELSMPCETISDYFLPEYADKNTLVVLTSYSGTTEEVLSCAHDAKAKNCKMLILTKGGPLAEFAEDNNIPSYIFDGSLNPAGVPRLGNGYTILGLLGLLNKTGLFEIAEHEITRSVKSLGEKIPDLKSRALADYTKFINKIPVVITAEHLSGNAQILRNQFNETSKSFSSFFLIPDLNHHLMEGLARPEGAPLAFLFLNSPDFSTKIKKRVELTIDVVKQNNLEAYEFMTDGQSIYDDFLETLVYGSYLTLFLALEYKLNPAINPWVDYFKNKLT